MRYYNTITPGMWIHDVSKTLNNMCWPAKLPARVMEVILAKFDELQQAFKPEFEALSKAEQMYLNYGYGGAKPMKKLDVTTLPEQHQLLLAKREELRNESNEMDKLIAELGYTSNYHGTILVQCTLAEVEAARAEMAARKKSVEDRWRSAISELTGIAKQLAVEKIAKTKSELPKGLVEKLDAITLPALPPAVEHAQLEEGQ